jgi:excisionase family DNA binding protein
MRRQSRREPGLPTTPAGICRLMPDVPTLREAAAWLRLPERSLDDLGRSRRLPAAQVGGKWLFPRAQRERWLAAQAGGPDAAHRLDPPPILAGSHHPLLDRATRQSGCGLALRAGGSLGKLAAGSALAAATHLLGPDSGAWSEPGSPAPPGPRRQPPAADPICCPRPARGSAPSCRSLPCRGTRWPRPSRRAAPMRASGSAPRRRPAGSASCPWSGSASTWSWSGGTTSRHQCRPCRPSSAAASSRRGRRAWAAMAWRRPAPWRSIREGRQGAPCGEVPRHGRPALPVAGGVASRRR